MGLDHVPPNNADAERAVLGALLMPGEGPGALLEVVNMGLSETHFYQRKHQLIFDAVCSLHRKGIPADLLTVTKKLEQLEHLKQAGGVPYLSEMIDAVPTAANVAYYAKMVKDVSARRSILRHLSEVAKKVDDEAVDIDEIIEDIHQTEDLLPQLNQDQRHSMPVDAETFCQMETKPIPMIVGKGLIPAFGYTMLAGYAKSGKTTLAIQLCLSIITGKPFVNKFPIGRPGAETLYCYLENTDDGIRKIIMEQRAAWGAPIEDASSLHLLNAQKLRLHPKGDLRHLRNMIKEKQIKLCIIDPISLALQGDQNDYAVVRTLINALHDIGSDTGAAFSADPPFPQAQRREAGRHTRHDRLISLGQLRGKRHRPGEIFRPEAPGLQTPHLRHEIRSSARRPVPPPQ